MPQKNKSKSCQKISKYHNFMYTQQIDHLPNGMTPQDLYQIVDEKLKCEMWAGIVQDKDTKEDGVTLVKAHLHIMMHFKNARSLNSIAKKIGDNPQYIEIWNKKNKNNNGDKDNYKNGFTYLVHATAGARERQLHQYSCDEVTANFDYKSFVDEEIKKWQKNQRSSSSKNIDGILDSIGAGKLSLKEAKLMLSGSDYAKYAQKLLRAHELFLEKKADKLYHQMKEENMLVEVHWFYGKTETGKTFLAKKLAEEKGDYYIASATKDAFQYYQAEPVIILDELRPRIIPYSELLGMLNPFSLGQTVVSSRFYNKPLACRVFFVTTPFDPVAFYEKYNLESTTDSGIQLYRRLSSVLKFDQDYIYNMEFNKKKGIYIESQKKENLYSRKQQKEYMKNNIFDSI